MILTNAASNVKHHAALYIHYLDTTPNVNKIRNKNKTKASKGYESGNMHG